MTYHATYESYWHGWLKAASEGRDAEWFAANRLAVPPVAVRRDPTEPLVTPRMAQLLQRWFEQ
jgi:hypothetical protein